MKDHPNRSFLKAVSWRVFGSIITTVTVFIVTGKLKFSLFVGFIEIIFKIVLFYIHERIWENIGWGKIKINEKNI